MVCQCLVMLCDLQCELVQYRELFEALMVVVVAEDLFLERVLSFFAGDRICFVDMLGYWILGAGGVYLCCVFVFVEQQLVVVVVYEVVLVGG